MRRVNLAHLRLGRSHSFGSACLNRLRAVILMQYL